VTFRDMQIVGSAAFSFSGVGLASGTQVATQTVAPGLRFVEINRTAADAKDGGYTDLGIVFRFSPSTVGTHVATVTVWHDGPGGQTTFELTGEGMRAKAVVSSGTTLPAVTPVGEFGAVTFRAPGHEANLSGSQTAYILNETGIDLLAIQRLRIVGQDAQAFAITGHTGAASGFAPTRDVLTPALKQAA